MKNKLGLLSVLFLLAGLGIIIAAFFLFLRNLQEENLFYLNMVATCFVFVTIFFRAFDIFGTASKVAASGSAYGLRWYGIRFYTPLALFLIILSILLKWPFNPCLIGHLILLFILLMFFFLGAIAKKSVNESMEKIEARKNGLKKLSEQISYLEMQNQIHTNGAYQQDINLLKEGIRYITASNNPSAINLENKLFEKLRLITQQMEQASQPDDVIHSEFKECLTLIELRKKQY